MRRRLTVDVLRFQSASDSEINSSERNSRESLPGVARFSSGEIGLQGVGLGKIWYQAVYSASPSWRWGFGGESRSGHASSDVDCSQLPVDSSASDFLVLAEF